MKSTGRMVQRERDPGTPASDHCAEVCQGAEDREEDLPTSAGWYGSCYESCIRYELEEDDCEILPPAIQMRGQDALEGYWCEAGLLRGLECSGGE